MSYMDFSLSSFLIGSLLGGLICFRWYLKEQRANQEIRQSLAILQSSYAQEQKSALEKQQLLQQASQELSHTFKSLSSESLIANNQIFFDLAKNTFENLQSKAKEDLSHRQESIQKSLKPIEENLKQFQSHIQVLEKNRLVAYASLTEQIKSLLSTQSKLEIETHKLVKSLRTPNVRGQWGEMHLRRTVELAGMLSHVDFFEQVCLSGIDGGTQRPDMLIHLPNSKQVVVDAKAPLLSYLEAAQCNDESIAQQHLQSHARHIRDHIIKLGTKQYWKSLSSSPEFVVLFLPGEMFFSSALEQDPSLIEFGIEQKVLLATPTTLIALLKAVAYGWQQETIAKEAQTICSLGGDFYERICIFTDHFKDLGKNLDKSVESFNKSLVSIDSRLLPVARKLKDLHVKSSKALPSLHPIESNTKPVHEWIEQDNLI